MGRKTYKNGEKSSWNFFSTRENLKISFHAYSLLCLKMSAQNNFGNSNNGDFKFFVPLPVLQTQNSKGRQIF